MSERKNESKREAVDQKILWKAFQKHRASGYKRILREGLGPVAVFTGEWTGTEKQRQLEGGELLPGELDACTFRVGTYSVRFAQRLYRPFPVYGQSFQEEGVPIVREELTDEAERYEYDQFAEYVGRQRDIRRQAGAAFSVGSGMEPYSSHFRLIQEVSAKPLSSAEGYRRVCRATHASNYQWTESVASICTVKRNLFAPDKQAALFVCVHFCGSSHSSRSWCKLLPDGTLTIYQEDTYGRGNYTPPLKL